MGTNKYRADYGASDRSLRHGAGVSDGSSPRGPIQVLHLSTKRECPAVWSAGRNPSAGRNRQGIRDADADLRVRVLPRHHRPAWAEGEVRRRDHAEDEVSRANNRATILWLRRTMAAEGAGDD